MDRWLQRTKGFLNEHGTAVLVTQLSVEGSAPREAGTKMLVSEHALLGTIGGGNLEHIAIHEARALMQQASQDYQIHDYPLGPRLGQCCGGHVRLLLETISEKSSGWIDDALRTHENDGAVYIQTSLKNDRVRKSVSSRPHLPRPSSDPLISSHAMSGDYLAGARPSVSQVAYIVERVSLRAPALFVFGAGHVGRAVINVLGASAFDVSWYDSRSSLTGGRVGHTSIQHLNDVPEVVALAPENAFYLIFTHCHDDDYQLLEAILRRRDAVYCGLIGSATKRARFLKRLRYYDLSEELLAPFVCPIGLNDLKSKDPAVIAVGVAAQLFRLLESAPAQSSKKELITT